MKDPLYERAKSKIQLAIYFAKEMIEELGKDKALEIIGKAYQKYSNDTFPEPYLDIPMEKRFQKFINMDMNSKVADLLKELSV